MVPRKGLEPPLSFEKRILSHKNVHSHSDNARLINSFISDRKLRGLSPNTIKFYEGYLDRFVTTISVPLLEQTKQGIIDFITSRTCNAGGKHAYFRVLRAFYIWCLSEELLDKSPMANLKAPKVPKPLRPSLSLKDLTKLLNHSSKLRDKLILALLADTGLRLSELANINESDIDLPNRTIVVWGKGARQRKVAYGEISGGILQDYLFRRDTGEKVFDILPRGISEILRRLEQETGIKCNAHMFRRTFATHAIRNEMNVFHVQSLLGHSSLTMTPIYSEQVDSEDAVRAYRPVIR